MPVPTPSTSDRDRTSPGTACSASPTCSSTPAGAWSASCPGAEPGHSSPPQAETSRAGPASGRWAAAGQLGIWQAVSTPNVATVRQNLSLIVDGRQQVADLASDSNKKWGATLGNNVFVWRSGVGVDANGGLIYVAGSALSVASLAVLLQRAGAVRAMELDINSAWVSGFTYQQLGSVPSAVQGVKLLANMPRPTNHDLMPGERDFFAPVASR